MNSDQIVKELKEKIEELIDKAKDASDEVREEMEETMLMLLEENGKPLAHEELTEETLEDLRFSMKTIQKRSDNENDMQGNGNEANWNRIGIETT